jgi:holo-[acyl-carrier protein] synthase
MIIGIGVDLVDIARFEQSIIETPKLLDRLFTSKEIDLKPQSLAARFAAKEAMMKAVGSSEGLAWQEIQVSKDLSGKPVLEVSGTTAETVKSKGIKTLHLSLSHDGGFSIAYVIAEG